MKRRNTIVCAGVIWCGLAGAAAVATDKDAWLEAGRTAFTLNEKKVEIPIPSVPWCPADWDHSDTVDLTDLYPFLAEWFGGSCGGDVNWDGQLTVQDIFDFMGMLAVGSCPPATQPDKK